MAYTFTQLYGLYLKLSIFIQFIISFILLTDGSRQELFFNNPNQLGYYGLIMITFLFMFKKSNEEYIYIVMAFYLVLISNSSAAIIGALLVITASIILLKIDIIKKFFVTSIFVITIIFIYLKIEVLEKYKFISSILSRFDNKNENVDLVSGRGYGRLFEIKSNFVWGVGEGLNERFIHLSGSELHSTLMGILISYGIIGIILFLILLHQYYFFSIIKSQGLNIFFIGILFYWLTHQGIRSSLFWILITTYTIYINSKKTEEKLKF